MADPTGGAMVTVTGDKECASFFRLCAALSPSGMFRGLRKGAMRVERAAKANAPVDRGMLRASIHREEHEEAKVIYIGPSVIYGRIQELGGVIRPKKGQWLTFQVGVKGLREAKATARKMGKSEGARTVRMVGGAPIYSGGGMTGKGLVEEAEANVGWVRVRQVTIRPQPYLGPALDANIANIERDVSEGVSAALQQAHLQVPDIGRLL